MSQGNRKPDQRARADRAGSYNIHDPNLAEAAILRNERHAEVLEKPHLWRAELRRSGLPASAIVVGLSLVDGFANRKTGRCFPSYEAIAEDVNASVRFVRYGVDALRKAGLLETVKRGFDTSFSFFFSLGRSDCKQSVRIELEVTADSQPKRLLTVTRNDYQQSPNLRIELSEETIEQDGVPCVPPSAVVASAPPVDIPALPTCLPRTALVAGNGQPSDFLPEKEEEAIRCPSSLVDQIKRLHAILGSDADKDVIGDLASAWAAIGVMTISDIKRRAERKLRRAS